MSRIGKKEIPIPSGVQVNIQEDNRVTVKGPLGKLERSFDPSMTIEMENGHIKVGRPSDDRRNRALHGTTRALLANMIMGVTEGFQKVLQIEGVGYRVEASGDSIVLRMGHSHPVIFDPPEGITFEIHKNYRGITVKGPDKELVGQIAANIKDVRSVEPYKGKGIRYEGEYVRRKAGKTG